MSSVIHNPPWWTLSRLLWMLVIMSVVLLAGFAWVFVLNRRVRQQTAIIQQKLQHEAMLEERTRIAREFHDTLEQELVAITIQLETVAAQFDTAPRVARQMLDLARNMSRRSLFGGAPIGLGFALASAGKQQPGRPPFRKWPS